MACDLASSNEGTNIRELEELWQVACTCVTFAVMYERRNLRKPCRPSTAALSLDFSLREERDLEHFSEKTLENTR